MASVITLMDLTISAPDHSTISRRAVTLPVIQAASVPHGPLHLLIDSTGLQVYGAGQWLEAKHGAKSRRKWRKLHLAVDADNGMIVARTLTDQDTDDPSQVAPLLDQIDGEIAKVTADGGYDGAPTYAMITARDADIEVVIPPRSTAVLSGETGPLAQRDTTSLGELAARFCRPAPYQRRRVRAINPHAPDDAVLLAAISRGEFALNGLRNRDIRPLLFPKPARNQAEQKRQAAAISRKRRLLRAHRLIRKLPRTHRYLLTKAGRIAVTALIAARNANTQQLTRLAA